MRQRAWHRATVMTQYFHVTRTRLALRKVMDGPITSAHATFFEWREGYSILREVVALQAYWLQPL